MKIYVIKNDLNSLMYVGRTTQSLNKRFKVHKAFARDFVKEVPSLPKHTPFHKEMGKLGVEHFYIELLEECDNALANEREIFWTNELNTIYPNGYNYNFGDGQQSKRVDLVGQKFANLTVESLAYVKGFRTYWNCLCDCGNKTTVACSKLLNGHTQSCGCLKSSQTAKSNHTRCLHGYYKGNYINVKDYCLEHNISYSMVKQRVALGYDLETAIDKPSRVKRGWSNDSSK